MWSSTLADDLGYVQQSPDEAEVLFTLLGDRWLRVEDNIAAVAAHIGALRGIDRWGVGSVRQAFAGYKRLAAGDASTPWWEVLGIDRQAPAVTVKQAYKKLAKLHHPDRETGNLERFQAISKAWQEYQKTRAS